ncbi:MAG: P-II family nitrogen regulator [Bacteroidetes bacterium]|nr:P-II family nitrogen regulator [Bacteroidota bacterium]
MKLITAVIRSYQLPAVRAALYDREISKITISNILGSVQEDKQSDSTSQDDTEIHELQYRGAVRKIHTRQRTRVEVAVAEELVETAIEAISGAARTGEMGDGIIFITDIHDWVNIRTGERGSKTSD